MALHRLPTLQIRPLEFNERYRIALPNSKSMVTIPAWVCDGANCHYWYAARQRTTWPRCGSSRETSAPAQTAS